MTVDPRVGFWFSIVMAIVSALGICGTQLTTLFGDVMANKILAAIVMLNVVNSAINAILHAIPSKPGAANEFPLGPKAVPVILLAIALCALTFPHVAIAAQLRAPAVTGNIAKDIQTDIGNASPTASPIAGQGGLLSPDQLIKTIIGLASPDLAYAVAMATSANTNSSSVRLSCIKAIQVLNAQASGANLKNADGSAMVMPPEPHIFTDLEIIAEGIDSLSPTGPLYTSCAGAAALAQMNVLTFINQVVTGVAASALAIPK